MRAFERFSFLFLFAKLPKYHATVSRHSHSPFTVVKVGQFGFTTPEMKRELAVLVYIQYKMFQ